MSERQDPYARFGDLSETPVADVIVGLLTMCLILGGGLAAVYAIGFFAVGRPEHAWPLVGTFTALAAVNIGARTIRSAILKRRRSPKVGGRQHER